MEVRKAEVRMKHRDQLELLLSRTIFNGQRLIYKQKPMHKEAPPGTGVAARMPATSSITSAYWNIQGMDLTLPASLVDQCAPSTWYLV